MTKIRAKGTIVGLAVLLVACGDIQAGTLTGTVTADGSSTVFPITQAVAEEFRSVQSDVEVSVGVSGTGGGFEKFCNGETDLQDASRAIKDEEVQRCRRNGIRYLELEVALDGLAVVVHPENDWIECVTTEELRQIWRPESRVERWRSFRASLPNRDLTLYGPGTDSGTFDYFTDEIVGEEGASRSDFTASEDDNVLVRGIAGDEDSLGYFGFAYYEENSSLLKLLGVDAGKGCVRASRETITSGEYPLSRPLYVYVSSRATRRPEARAFVDFYLEVVPELAPAVGYVGLPKARHAEMVAAWHEFAPRPSPAPTATGSP